MECYPFITASKPEGITTVLKLQKLLKKYFPYNSHVGTTYLYTKKNPKSYFCNIILFNSVDEQ